MKAYLLNIKSGVLLVLTLVTLFGCHAHSTGEVSGTTLVEAGPGNGTSDGGGGLTIRTPKSRYLVLWDLFSNDPRIEDNTVGDQIKSQSASSNEWVDYREFKSFSLLKSKLLLWKKRAPNFYGLINENNFASDDVPNRLQILFIKTPNYVQKISEVAVPKKYVQTDAKAFPTAIFDDSKGFVFINESNWNKTGLLSQSGILLHERMRRLQVKFYLTNIEMQRIVYFILTYQPDETSTQDFDDEHFSESWVLVHKTEQMKKLNISAPIPDVYFDSLKAYFYENLFKCIKSPQPSSCVKDLYTQLGSKGAIAIDPQLLLNADQEVNAAVKIGILGLKDPGAFAIPSASMGEKNFLPTVANDLPFAKFYGSFSIDQAKCKNNSRGKTFQNLCEFDAIEIAPANNAQMPNTTSFNVIKHLSTGGMTFASTWFHLNPESSGQSYKENGDESADFLTGLEFSKEKKNSKEYKMTKLADRKYLVRIQYFSNIADSAENNYDSDFEFEVLKK